LTEVLLELIKYKTLILDEFDKSLQLVSMSKCHLSLVINKLNKRVLVSLLQILRFQNTPELSIRRFWILENEQETNLSTKWLFRKDKIGSLFSLICSLKSQSAIVFCNHRDAAAYQRHFKRKGIYSTYYHGGMDQDERAL
jgi:superfamily II DNA/RNA helicase